MPTAMAWMRKQKIEHLKNNIKADAGIEHSLSTARSNRKKLHHIPKFCELHDSHGCTQEQSM